MPVKTKTTPEQQAAVFGQMLESMGQMPTKLARHILNIQFTEADQDRVSELLTKNSEERISRVEIDELDGLIRAGNWLAILQAQARIALKAPRRRTNSRA
jgi:hypothetical protein